MQNFFEILNKVHSLSPNEEKLIEEQLYTEVLPSKHYLLQAGENSTRIGFIIEGVIKIFFYDDDGNEVIRCFHKSGQFFGADGYLGKELSDSYIQTVSKTKILFLNKKSEQILSNTINSWNRIVKEITEIALIEKHKLATKLLHSNAEEKYKTFIAVFGADNNQIPLKDIASYLGIKQQSLSRIRKNIRW